MELNGARVLVAGATGAIGQALTEALVERGARVVPAGRDADRLARLGEVCGTEPLTFDVVDQSSCERVVADAAEALGGLDLLVVTVGVAGFGPAVEADPAVVEELFAVNTLGPMALVRAAAPRLSEGGGVAVLSAILADLPTAGMAEYSAAKTALSAWLGVLRREQRRRFRVLDVRPPHLDTGLESRALGGKPPKLPPPMPAGTVVEQVLTALEQDASEIVYDAQAKGLVVR